MLSHYKAVVWETGDDVIPRAQGQVAVALVPEVVHLLPDDIGADAQALDRDESRIYDLVVRRFLGAFVDPPLPARPP